MNIGYFNLTWYSTEASKQAIRILLDQNCDEVYLDANIKVGHNLLWKNLLKKVHPGDTFTIIKSGKLSDSEKSFIEFCECCGIKVIQIGLQIPMSLPQSHLIPRKKLFKHQMPFSKIRVINLYLWGMPTNAIAEKFGIHKSSLQRKLAPMRQKIPGLGSSPRLLKNG